MSVSLLWEPEKPSARNESLSQLCSRNPLQFAQDSGSCPKVSLGHYRLRVVVQFGLRARPVKREIPFGSAQGRLSSGW